MKNLTKTLLVLASLAVPVLANAEQDKVNSVTIYGNNPNLWNQPYWFNNGSSEGYAILNFDKTFEFQEGVNEVVVENLPATVEVSSVKLAQLKGTKIVVEQIFSKSSLSSEDLLNANLGKDIEVEQQAGERTVYYRGKLLQGSPQLFIKDENRVRLLNSYSSILFPDDGAVAAGNSIKWVVASKDEGDETLNYNFKTTGINWSTSYDIYYDDNDSAATRLEGWAEISNNSNIDISQSGLKLIAGQINEVAGNSVARMKSAEMVPMLSADSSYSGSSGGANFQSQNFSDYHMYTIDRKVDLKPFSFKKIKLFADKLQVKPEKNYIYNGADGKKNAAIEIKIKNNKENGLGIPMPGGKYTIYIKDKDGKFELAGQDTAEHKSEGEEIKLNIGNAFDITAERTQLEQSNDQARRVGTYKIRVEFANAKDKEAIVTAKEIINSGSKWQITNSTLPYKKHSANEVWFDVVIPAKGQNTLEYTAEYYW